MKNKIILEAETELVDEPSRKAVMRLDAKLDRLTERIKSQMRDLDERLKELEKS